MWPRITPPGDGYHPSQAKAGKAEAPDLGGTPAGFEKPTAAYARASGSPEGRESFGWLSQVRGRFSLLVFALANRGNPDPPKGWVSQGQLRPRRR